ncbi:MAG: hypothetical protein KatS3mg102_2817 [Planctomycetota bacterium]|nr:MAG: hypothetical protein KatS3mg102_2817 [Planctomycetota bacterium]
MGYVRLGSRDAAACWALLALLLGAGPAAGDGGMRIATDRDGVYEAGPWRYEISITNPGTRSEGRVGRLFYGGRQLPPPPARNDYYVTPLGKLYWVGEPVAPFGPHGWMPAPQPAAPEGIELGIPSQPATEPRQVRLAVLVPAAEPLPEGTGQRSAFPAGWVRERLQRSGVHRPAGWRDWKILDHEDAVVHDSRHYGFLRLRRGPDGAWGEPVVQIEASGQLFEIERSGARAPLGARAFGEPIALSLFPAGGGERRLLYWRSGGRFGELEAWVALEACRPVAHQPPAAE